MPSQVLSLAAALAFAQQAEQAITAGTLPQLQVSLHLACMSEIAPPAANLCYAGYQMQQTVQQAACKHLIDNNFDLEGKSVYLFIRKKSI